jgi:CBS domain-containing protein
MIVRDVMTREVECTSPEATLQQAALRMRELDVGLLPVCGHDRLTGTISDRDMVIRAVADGRDPKTFTVYDVMTPEVVYCFEDQDLSTAAQLMQEKQIRRLPVLSRDKRLVGIISLGDVAVESHNDRLSGHTLAAVSEHAHSE